MTKMKRPKETMYVSEKESAIMVKERKDASNLLDESEVRLCLLIGCVRRVPPVRTRPLRETEDDIDIANLAKLIGPQLNLA